jgi:Ca2+-transporting ATPase
MRARGSSLIANQITGNPLIWGSLLLCTGLILCAVYLPDLADVLRLSAPGRTAWFVILAASLMPLAIGQLSKGWRRPGRQTRTR